MSRRAVAKNPRQRAGNRRMAEDSTPVKSDELSNVGESREEVCDGGSSFVFLRATYPQTERFKLEGEPPASKLYKLPVGRPVRIYCDGVYDLFHYGHAKQLEQAKKLFPTVHLIVGVTNDKDTLRLKGTTVMSEQERYESVRHCRHVDEVVEDAPWVITEEFMVEHQIDYVAHDDLPYAGEGHSDIYAWLKESERFIPTLRTVDISTTSLITRLLRDYDSFLRRQILRGISREDLNISSFKESQVKLSNELEGMKNEVLQIFRHWERLSNLWLEKFMKKFENSEFIKKIENSKAGWMERIVSIVKR